MTEGVKINNDPNGSRTRVFAVKGRCPKPLDDGVGRSKLFYWHDMVFPLLVKEIR